jgi:mRNA-degrading endonuclease RelE of RelBE toxin-antitoxin system
MAHGMAYSISPTKEFEEALARLKKEDRALYNRLGKKIDELCAEPHFRKPLGNVLKGSFRVHVGSFVLRYRIDEGAKVIIPISFVHHDDAYRNM